MRHYNCVTRKLCTYPTQRHQLRRCNAVCICMQPYFVYVCGSWNSSRSCLTSPSNTTQTRLWLTVNKFSEITIVREQMFSSKIMPLLGFLVNQTLLKRMLYKLAFVW